MRFKRVHISIETKSLKNLDRVLIKSTQKVGNSRPITVEQILRE